MGRVFKIVIIGQSGVGKTAFARKSVADLFVYAHHHTFNTGIYTLRLKESSVTTWDTGDPKSRPFWAPEYNYTHPLDSWNGETDIWLWDTSSSEVRSIYVSPSCQFASGALLLIDKDTKTPVEDCLHWTRKLYEFSPNVPVLVVINKCDNEELDLNIDEILKGVRRSIPSGTFDCVQFSVKKEPAVSCQQLLFRLIKSISSTLRYKENDTNTDTYVIEN
jgi:GTPase SAR1 family protein